MAHTFAIAVSPTEMKSYAWFKNIGDILQLKNGEGLYVKHGHQNMVTYSRCTEGEREAILQERDQSVVHLEMPVLMPKV